MTHISDLENQVIVLNVSFGLGHVEVAGRVRRVFGESGDHCWVGDLCLDSSVKVHSDSFHDDGHHWKAYLKEEAKLYA